MSDEYIVKHCSPTLAGLKTANLFTCAYTSKAAVYGAVHAFNAAYRSKGVFIMPLRFGKDRALIYLFRPEKLARDLSDERAKTILLSLGYSRFEPEYCISVLPALSDKKVALFGSYGWGDGQWMRDWEDACKNGGVNLCADSVIANEAPDDEAVAACEALGKALI